MAGQRDAGGQSKPRVAVRLLWFAALWLAGVAAVGAVALAIRQMLL